MTQFPYDPGLRKSRFGSDMVDAPILTSTEQHIETGDGPISEENYINTEFNNAFLGELKKAASMMQSLYTAIFPLNPEIADKLLQQAFLDLRTSIREIAADFSLGAYRSLSRKSKHTKGGLIPPTSIIANSSVSSDLILTSEPGENTDPLLYDRQPQHRESPYKREPRSTRSNPVKL